MMHSSKMFFTWVAGLMLAGTVSAADSGCSDALDFERKLLAGEYPQWNFHKYLIDRQGRVAASYAGKVEPLGGELEAAVKGLL